MNRLIFLTIIFLLSSHHLKAEDAYRIFKSSGKVGLKDASGKVLIPAKYEKLGWSNGKDSPSNETIGFLKKGIWGLLSIKNKVLISPRFTQLYPSGNNKLVAAQKGRVSSYDFLGLINSEGKVILPFKYTYIEGHTNSAIVGVKFGRKIHFGVVDFSGRTVIPVNYSKIDYFSGCFIANDFNKKITVFDKEGRWMNLPNFDYYERLNDQHIILAHYHLRGLMDTEGKLILPIQYKAIRKSNEGLEILPFDRWKVLNEELKELRQFEYDEISPYEKYRFQVKANDREWIINGQDSALTSPYNEKMVVSENGLSLIKRAQKWGLIVDGKEVITPEYDSAFLSGDMFFGFNNGWTMLDRFNVQKSTFTYDEVKGKSGRLFAVKRNDHWGFLDRFGEEAIHCVYEDVGSFVGDNVVVKFHGQTGIIDRFGEWIVPPSRSGLQLINDQLYIEREGDLTTLKDFIGSTIYFSQNRLEPKDGYLLEHLSNGKFWQIDYSGRIMHNKQVIEKPEDARELSEGLRAVKIDGMYGFVDDRNRLRIANRYEQVGDFKQGLAAFKLRGKWGFIDKNERIIIQPLYSEVKDFTNGVAMVRKDKSSYIIDITGRKVSLEFSLIEPLSSGRFIAKSNGKVGLLNEKGRIQVNVKYDQLKRLENGNFVIQKFGQYGLISSEGVDILPLNYDYISYDHDSRTYLTMKKSKWKKVNL